MPKPDLRLLRFIRALLSGAEARRQGRSYEVGTTTAPARAVTALLEAGALDGDAHVCRANGTTRNWLRRQMLEPGDFAGQHRHIIKRGGLTINLTESPLARLATAPAGGTPFLELHQVEAGERVRRLFERASLRPRTTITYSASLTAGGDRNHLAEISDLAADARKAIAEIHEVLPRDCAGVVLDVCGLLKGIQEVETERGWPRRSAKLVLRIGLDKLAEHFGIGAHAIGKASAKPRVWLDDGARPSGFG